MLRHFEQRIDWISIFHNTVTGSFYLKLLQKFFLVKNVYIYIYIRNFREDGELKFQLDRIPADSHRHVGSYLDVSTPNTDFINYPC